MELLEILLSHTETQHLLDTLGYALLNACWYNNIYLVPCLVDKGADIYFKSSSGKTLYECAKDYGERFGDYTLHIYINSYVDTGELASPAEFYTGTGLLGDKVYAR